MLVIQLCPTLCDPLACQALLSMEVSRQEIWNELPFYSPEDLPNPGIEPGLLALQADSLPTKPLGKPNESLVISLSNSLHSNAEEAAFLTRA